MIEFIKGEEYPPGEDEVIRRLGRHFQLVKGGRGFVGILGDELPLEEHRAAAQATLKRAREAISSGKFDLIVLDEINVALNLKLISKKEVVQLIEKVPKDIYLILTGRGAPKELIDRADLVTEMREVKHPFSKGKLAKRGIEF